VIPNVFGELIESDLIIGREKVRGEEKAGRAERI
jgi:hypothetical protein